MLSLQLCFCCSPFHPWPLPLSLSSLFPWRLCYYTSIMMETRMGWDTTQCVFLLILRFCFVLSLSVKALTLFKYWVSPLALITRSAYCASLPLHICNHLQSYHQQGEIWSGFLHKEGQSAMLMTQDVECPLFSLSRPWPAAMCDTESCWRWSFTVLEDPVIHSAFCLWELIHSQEPNPLKNINQGVMEQERIHLTCDLRLCLLGNSFTSLPFTLLTTSF